MLDYFYLWELFLAFSTSFFKDDFFKFLPFFLSLQSVITIYCPTFLAFKMPFFVSRLILIALIVFVMIFLYKKTSFLLSWLIKIFIFREQTQSFKWIPLRIFSWFTMSHLSRICKVDVLIVKVHMFLDISIFRILLIK